MTSQTSQTSTDTGAPVAGQPCPIDGKSHRAGSKALEACQIAYGATEAPATETTVTEIPATEAPAKPASKASKTSKASKAPATEAPATEAPATEAPATEAPASKHSHAFTSVFEATESGIPLVMMCSAYKRSGKPCTKTREATEADIATHSPAPATEAPASKASKARKAPLGKAPGSVPEPTAHKRAQGTANGNPTAGLDAPVAPAMPDMSWVPTAEQIKAWSVDQTLARVDQRQEGYVEDAMSLARDVFAMFVSGKWQNVMATTKGGNTSTKKFAFTETDSRSAWASFCERGLHVRQVFGIARSNSQVKDVRARLIRALYELTTDDGVYLASVKVIGESVGLAEAATYEECKRLGLKRYNTVDRAPAPKTPVVKYSATDLRTMTPEALIALIGGDQWQALAALATQATDALGDAEPEAPATEAPATEAPAKPASKASKAPASKPATGAGETIREAMAGALASKAVQASKAPAKPTRKRAGSKASNSATLTDAEVSDALAMAG